MDKVILGLMGRVVERVFKTRGSPHSVRVFGAGASLICLKLCCNCDSGDRQQDHTYCIICKCNYYLSMRQKLQKNCAFGILVQSAELWRKAKHSEIRVVTSSSQSRVRARLNICAGATVVRSYRRYYSYRQLS